MYVHCTFRLLCQMCKVTNSRVTLNVTHYEFEMVDTIWRMNTKDITTHKNNDNLSYCPLFISHWSHILTTLNTPRAYIAYEFQPEWNLLRRIYS